MNPLYGQWLAEKIVECSRDIPGFCYRGDKELGVTWAITNQVVRDDKPTEKTRYYRLEQSMKRRFPDDVDYGRATDGLCGWRDQLMVRMLDDKGVVTKAGIAVIDRLKRKHHAMSHRDLAQMFEEFEGELKKPRDGTPRKVRDIPRDVTATSA